MKFAADRLLIAICVSVAGASAAVLAQRGGTMTSEQADRRWVAGGRVSQRRKMRWGRRLGEYMFGAEVRNDDVGVVGLYHTERRAPHDQTGRRRR